MLTRRRHQDPDTLSAEDQQLLEHWKAYKAAPLTTDDEDRALRAMKDGLVPHRVLSR